RRVLFRSQQARVGSEAAGGTETRRPAWACYMPTPSGRAFTRTNLPELASIAIRYGCTITGSSCTSSATTPWPLPTKSTIDSRYLSVASSNSSWVQSVLYKNLTFSLFLPTQYSAKMREYGVSGVLFSDDEITLT